MVAWTQGAAQCRRDAFRGAAFRTTPRSGVGPPREPRGAPAQGESPGALCMFLEECTAVKNHAWFTMSVEKLNTGVFENPTCFVPGSDGRGLPTFQTA